MADTLYFSRDTKVYMEIGSVVWELPVLDGFSFSQGTNTSEITLNEMTDGNGKSRRSRQMFNDSFAPAEWSFATYARPFKSTVGATAGWEDTNANHHAVEEALWANLVSNPTFTAADSASAAWSKGITNTTSDMTVDFKDSEVSELGTFNLYFVMGAAKGSSDLTVYKLADCVVNEAGIDFDIDGIAQINWSGNASLLSEEASAPTVDINEGVTATNNFIRNRLTSLSITAADSTTYPGAGGGVYNTVLTGGNITFSNNVSFLTPETLGIVNQPIGHVTGTRSISGSFTCYLNAEGGSTADLFEDLMEARTTITNSFGLVFGVGGGNAPKIDITLPKCHLEMPSHSIDDIISLEVSFHALPNTIDPAGVEGSDLDDFEAKLVYTGTTV